MSQKQHQYSIENCAQIHKNGRFFHFDYTLSNFRSSAYDFFNGEKGDSKDVKICHTNPIRRTINHPNRLYRFLASIKRVGKNPRSDNFLAE
jgi:hypothetical protein